MTAPDSRDSVERVVAEMRDTNTSVMLGGRADYPQNLIAEWADRLQAIARGPQQAGGEDWPKVMGEYLAIMTRCDDAIRESGKATLSRADMEAIERYNLADEHLSMMQADRIAALQAEVARLNEQAEHLRSMYRNACRELALANEAALQARAALRVAQANDRRYRWLRKRVFVDRLGPAIPCGRSKIDADDAARTDAAIDAALNGGQDDA